MREYQIIINNPNLDQPTQEYYNRLFKEFSNGKYKINPEKCKFLGSIKCNKKEINNEI